MQVYPWKVSLLEDLGVKWFIKRDDLSGFEMGGNKVRKLEFLMAEALTQGCDCVVTIGGVQSNHCRATAAAAKHLGLDAYLVRVVPSRARDRRLFGHCAVPIWSHGHGVTGADLMP